MTSPTKAPPRKRVMLSPPSNMDDAVPLGDGVFEVPDEEEGSRIEERAPKIPTPTISEQVDSVRETANRARARLASAAGRFKPPARKPGVKRPRTSVESLISTVWALGGRVAGATGAWPVANVLALQSPVAGKILEDTVKNTVVDTLLQPFARLTQGSQVVMALVGPPVLVGIATARPETQPYVEPLLREALRAWLEVAGPKMIEKAEEEKRFREEYGATIDAMIQMIFTPPEGVVPDGGTIDG